MIILFYPTRCDCMLGMEESKLYFFPVAYIGGVLLGTEN